MYHLRPCFRQAAHGTVADLHRQFSDACPPPQQYSSFHVVSGKISE